MNQPPFKPAGSFPPWSFRRTAALLGRQLRRRRQSFWRMPGHRGLFCPWAHAVQPSGASACPTNTIPVSDSCPTSSTKGSSREGRLCGRAGNPTLIPARNQWRKTTSASQEGKARLLLQQQFSNLFIWFSIKKGNLKSKRNNKLISLQIICKGSKCIVNVCLYPTGNLMNFIDCFCIAVCCATSSTEIVAGLMLSLAHSVIAPCNLLPGKVTEKERRGVKNNTGGWGAKKKEREKSDSI